MKPDKNGNYDFLSPTPVDATFTHSVTQKAPYLITPQAKISMGYEYRFKYMKHIRIMLTTEFELLKSSQYIYDWKYEDSNNATTQFNIVRTGQRRVFFSLSLGYLFG